MKHFFTLIAASAALLCAGAAHAIQDCELNGEFVNPANGNTTAGKTGLMLRDDEVFEDGSRKAFAK